MVLIFLCWVKSTAVFYLKILSQTVDCSDQYSGIHRYPLDGSLPIFVWLVFSETLSKLMEKVFNDYFT